MTSTRQHQKPAIPAFTHLRNLGWGFLVAWGTVSTFTGAFSSEVAAISTAFWVANMATTTVGLVVLGLFSQKHMERDNPVGAMGISASLITVGTAVMMASLSGLVSASIPLSTAAGLLSGMGMALGTMCWGWSFARWDDQEIERSVLYSLALMIVCYAMSLVGGQAFVFTMLIALPFCSLACFALGIEDEKAEGGPATAIAPGSSAASALPGHWEFIRVGTGLLAAACCISILWSLLNAGVYALSESLYAASLLLGGGIALALALYCTTFANRLNLNTLYLWVVPLIMLSFFLLSCGGTTATFFGSACAFGAQMSLDAISLIYFCEMANRNLARSAMCVGLGRAFLEGGIFIGSLVSLPMVSAIDENALRIDLLLLLLAFLLTTITMFAMGEYSIFSSRKTDEIGKPAETPAEKTETLAESAGTSKNANDRNETPEETPLDRKCNHVAEDYGLSKREREVLGYLARGRSLPYIRNELGISKSTVGTHVEHIYTKLDVHSRDELISVVEAAAED